MLGVGKAAPAQFDPAFRIYAALAARPEGPFEGLAVSSKMSGQEKNNHTIRCGCFFVSSRLNYLV